MDGYTYYGSSEFERPNDQQNREHRSTSHGEHSEAPRETSSGFSDLAGSPLNHATDVLVEEINKVLDKVSMLEGQVEELKKDRIVYRRQRDRAREERDNAIRERDAVWERLGFVDGGMRNQELPMRQWRREVGPGQRQHGSPTGPEPLGRPPRNVPMVQVLQHPRETRFLVGEELRRVRDEAHRRYD